MKNIKNKNKKVVIKLENVNKSFLIFVERDKTLKDFLISSFSRRFKEHLKIDALKDINLTIRKGECVGIVGRNSAGKSTLLKIIAKVLKPDSGKVYSEGIILPLLELGVGFNPELTGIENIFLNGALLGIPKEKIKAQINKIIEFSELGKFIELKLKNYSSGMIARLAFSIATIHEPDIVLIDEVLAVGDSIFQDKCIKKIMEFKKAKKTIVFVSHDPNSIRMICDRLIVMNNGNIIFDGDVEQGLNFYNNLLNEIKIKKKDLSEDVLKNNEVNENKNTNIEEEIKIEKDKKEFLDKNVVKNRIEDSKILKFNKSKELIKNLINKKSNKKYILNELSSIMDSFNDLELKEFFKEMRAFANDFKSEDKIKILEILSELVNKVK